MVLRNKFILLSLHPLICFLDCSHFGLPHHVLPHVNVKMERHNSLFINILLVTMW